MMNRTNLLASVAIVLTAFAAVASVRAQAPILVENFNYDVGALLTSNGWTAHSAGGTNAIAVSSPGLTLTGYPGNGVGNAVALTTSGEDVNRVFPVQSSGSVYGAFLVTVSEASTDPAGGYFFHLGPDPVGTTFRGRVFVKKDASNNLAFGISKAATAAADIQYTGFTYSLNTTYLLVVKYTIVDGASNDTVNLFVRTDVPASEPTATLTATDVATQSDVSPGTVSLRQGSTATAPTVRVDSIRVGTSWASIVTQEAPRKAPVDFNGDGRSDYVVIREVSGNLVWYIQQNGSGALSGYQWGLSTDREVPADYDGDGKSDVAVWREAAGTGSNFFILRSSNSTVQIENFGLTGDDPSVVGDYDGDGKDDVATYRCPTGSPGQCTWFYRGSLNNPTGAITYIPWGFGVAGSPVPAAGDYDGDGKFDVCVFRNVSGQGQFVLRRSSDQGVEWVDWGLSTDSVVPRGDFDGDGKTDFAVARPLTQYNLYILERDGGGTGASPILFGSPALQDSAAFGDYDGDGRTDVGVWRSNADATQNFFWIRQSSNGSVILNEFGQAGDRVAAEWYLPRTP